jgi:hypothetical protein
MQCAGHCEHARHRSTRYIESLAVRVCLAPNMRLCMRQTLLPDALMQTVSLL